MVQSSYFHISVKGLFSLLFSVPLLSISVSDLSSCVSVSHLLDCSYNLEISIQALNESVHCKCRNYFAEVICPQTSLSVSPW